MIQQLVKRGDVAVDIGANVGYFTVLLGGQVGAEGHVFAFEPLPRNATLLQQSIRENSFGGRVTLESAAVGQSAGTVELISPLVSNNWGGAYLRTQDSAIPSDHEAITVRVINLDDYPLRRPVRFIKLDAEGAEMMAIRGGTRLLQEDRPTVLAELNPKQLKVVSGCSGTDVILQMASLGYRRCPLNGEGLQQPITVYDGPEIIDVVFRI